MSNGEPLHFTTHLLGLDEKRLHLFHTMIHGTTRELLCTTEQMLIHVDTQAASASPIAPHVYAALNAILATHQPLAIPQQVGRQMTINKKN